MRVLLTAFEPFGGERLNPSQEVARALREHAIPGLDVNVLELPVERFVAIDRTLQAMRNSTFDVVLMLGEAGGRFRVTPERIAVNVDDYRMPDNAGHQPRNEAIVQGAATAYFSTLPIEALVAQMHLRAIPAAVGDSAGTYLCNRLFFCVMHELTLQAAQGSRVPRAGFIHLPYVHEQAVTKALEVPSLSRQTLIDAVLCSLAVLRDER